MSAETLLPPSATPSMVALELPAAARIEAIDVNVIRRARYATSASAAFLPFLAYEESADLFNDAWDVPRQVNWIGAQWTLHRRRSSVGAVEDALVALGFGARLTEWFTYGGEPYTFRIEIDLFSRPRWFVEDYIEMFQACLIEKPVRADLTEIRAFLGQRMPEPRIATGNSAVVTFDLELVD